MTDDFKERLSEGKEKAGKALKKGFRWFFIILTVGLILFFWACSWTYSEGTRAGQLIKITKKGVVFKTYEGQLNMGGLVGGGDSDGLEGNIWNFSVMNHEVLQRIQTMEGKKVELHYRQRYKSMPWQAKTEYIIDEAREIKD